MTVFLYPNVPNLQCQSKVWTHLLIQHNYEITHMESCSKQKSVKQIATLCLNDSFAHSWHSVNQLHLDSIQARSSDAALHHSPSW